MTIDLRQGALARLRRWWSARPRVSMGREAGSTAPPPDRPRLREAWAHSRPGLAVVVALSAFINLLRLTIPLYIFQVLDRVIASRSIDTLLLLTAMTVFAVGIAALAEVTRRLMLSHWGAWIEQHFGRSLFVSGLREGAQRGPAGALADLRTISQFVSGSGASSWLDGIFAPAFLLVVYLIHPLFAAITLAGMLAMAVLGTLNDLTTRGRRSGARRAGRRSAMWLATANDNRQTVAGLNVGEKLASRWFRNASSRTRERLSFRVTGAGLNETMRLCEALQRIACYAVGVWLAVNGEMSVGGIIAGAVLGRLGTSSVRRAMAHWRQLALTRRAYRRMSRQLDQAHKRETGLHDADALPALSLDRVTFAYPGAAQPLLDGLSLSVPPGSILGVIGPSGSGKSTLARLIAGVQSPASGAVRFGSLDIGRYSEADRNALLGFLPQEVVLFNATIAENIASLQKTEDGAVLEAAKLAGIHDVIMRLPEGYETRMTGRQIALAGGEVRRLGLARALFGRPRLIVLDEPEANLDDPLIERLLEALNSCKGWGAVVVVMSQSQRLSAAFDRVLVLPPTAAAPGVETAPHEPPVSAVAASV